MLLIWSILVFLQIFTFILLKLKQFKSTKRVKKKKLVLFKY